MANPFAQMLPATTTPAVVANPFAHGGAVAAPARGAVAESSGVCLNHLAHARHMSRALFCQHLTTVGLAVGDGNCLHLTGVEGPLGVRINGIPSPPSPPPRRVA